jgi:hypothetical protein
MSLSNSPDRHTFQRDNYLKRKEELNEEPSRAYLELFKSVEQRKAELEADPEWQKDNLEYDLRSTDWILAKVRANDGYAQNLYAAMCNNEFQRIDVMPILKDQSCSYSWRYAGGIIADMQEKGDYIDWYCSGIRGGDSTLSDSQFVPEGVVTDEIREDLKRLGWNVLDEANDE